MPQEQIQKQKSSTKAPETQEADQEVSDLRDEKLTDTVDAMLDEIDGVLEENAEEFVKAYIQKGGE